MQSDANNNVEKKHASLGVQTAIAINFTTTISLTSLIHSIQRENIVNNS